MIRGYIACLLCILATTYCVYAVPSYKAAVIVPVADLVGAPIQTFFPQTSVIQAYHDLVVCGGKPAMHSCCPRLHQLLFNEIVTVIEEQDQEIRVQISSCFYVPKDRLAPQYTYWMLKQHVVPLQELEQSDPLLTISHSRYLLKIQCPSLIQTWSRWRYLGTMQQPVTHFLLVPDFKSQRTV